MDVAIVTGADSRFGDAVSRTLLQMGFRIHALGQNPDSSDYDERFYIPHPYGPGKLAEMKAALEEALETEGRLDLLVGLGGPELTTGWDESSPEALVRRLHGCLTEPLLAASVCLAALRKSKGFLIHGHRRPVAEDLSVASGYFEDAMRRAYDDLFLRHADVGLRTARILYAYPESGADSIQQDIADSVSRAFEIILRQKETCIVRELHVAPRGLGPTGAFPNLVTGVDPYQTTVLPDSDEEEEDPILIPTERPRHYVQIAEVKDITHGEDVPGEEEYYGDEREDERDYFDRDDEPGEEEPESAEETREARPPRQRKNRPPRQRGRGRGGRQSKPESGPDAPAPAEGSDDPPAAGSPEPPAEAGDSEPKPPARKSTRKRPPRRRKKPGADAPESPPAGESADTPPAAGERAEPPAEE
ncbi:MAG: hypothetical protein ACLFRP_02780 [Puniceicoccaceae bacterium]